MKRVLCGITLPELLIGLLIVAILSGIGIPSVWHYLHRKAQQTYLQQLQEAMVYSRHYALTHQVTVTLCPSLDGNTCSSDWQSGAIAFADPHNLHQPEADEAILYTLPPVPAGEQLTLTAFPKNNYLSFQGSGLNTHPTGHFDLLDTQTQAHSQLIFSKTGRLRVEYFPS